MISHPEGDEARLWLTLKPGVKLDFEKEKSIDLTLTVSDGKGGSATAKVTVTVTDMNEGPVAVGMVDTVTAEAGKAIDVQLDLAALFNDPEGSDSLRYELSGEPSWLSLTSDGRLRGEPPTTGSESAEASMVTITARDAGGEESEGINFYVVVDDGNDPVTGVNLLDDDGNKISEAEVAENDASGVVLGEITVDDIDHPMHPHGSHKVTVSDPRFEIREDAEGGFSLALKEGMSLDHERGGGEVRVTVTAQDINGEKKANGSLKGIEDSATFTIVVTNENDNPRAGTIGNWWVTVDDNLEAEDVGKGQWLTVDLEMDDGNPATPEYPAFTDRDAGDRLTYEISMDRGDWLEIDDKGRITNKEGTLPARGVYSVTVEATDQDGESSSASFNLNVALSGTDDDSTEDNQDPSIGGTAVDYREGSGEQRVATVTVKDGDQDIPDHPFAIKTVQIISITNRDNASDLNNAHLIDHDSDGDTPMRLWTTDDGTSSGSASVAGASNFGAGYAAALVLEHASSAGDTQTYHIWARDTDPSPTANTLDRLDHETVDDLDIVVRVTDGTAGATLTGNNGPGFDTDRITVDIIDANERPGAEAPHSALLPNGDMWLLTSASTPADEISTMAFPVAVYTNREIATAVNQSETAKVVLHINLSDVWDDPDDNHDDSDLTFTAASSTSWVNILYGGEGEWRDVNNGLNGEDDGGSGDDLTWGTGARTVGVTPADSDIVVVVEIDRTAETGSTGQGESGSIILTARDQAGLTATAKVPVVVVDQNLPIPNTDNVANAGAVTISGSPREDGTLRATFHASRDPDLAGSNPTENALVLYTWYALDAVDGTPTADNVIQSGTSHELKLTQGQVRDYIRVDVTYYEVFGGQFISGGDGDGQLMIEGGTQVVVTDTTSRAVSNTPDDGVGDFTVTAGANMLRASAVIRDGDYANSVVTPTIGGNTNIVYSWQVSDNGIGGWGDVDQTGDSTPETLTLDDGDGKYYRAVATYDADGVDDDTDASDGDDDVMESVYSAPIRIGDVRDLVAGSTPAPGSGQTVTPAALTPSGSLAPGGTLSISGTGVSSVQWQFESPAPGTVWTTIPGATGDLTLDQTHAGGMVRALVTYESTDPNNPGVTAVVLSAAVPIGGATASVRPTAVDDHEITASVSGTGHAARGPVAGDGVTSGQTVAFEQTVDLASLFQDIDTPDARLTFSAAAAASNSGLASYPAAPSLITGSRTTILRGDEGVLVLEPNGKLTYVSDQLRGHDGSNVDGAGNVLRLDITANDGTGNSANMAELSLRINVAPTDIDFSGSGATTAAASTSDIIADDYAADGFTFRGTSWDEVTLVEEVAASGDEILAILDVQDENFSGTPTIPGHSFGTHTVAVSDDDRFVITKSGGADARRDSDGDGSTFELRLVKGAKFDFEAESDLNGDRTDGKQIVLTFTATDGGGLSTPVPTATNGYAPIRLIVTINDDRTDNPPRPPATETPGLEDNEGSADPDDTVDNDGTNDEDVDGGDPTPPMDTMMMSALALDDGLF